jgi:uncharacterized DUF497 family protein
MAFEFDPAKSAANRAKHGIDFIEAQELWSDHARLEYPAPHPLEQRAKIIGRIGTTIWAAVVTYREDRIRLISVRRADRAERGRYGAADPD